MFRGGLELPFVAALAAKRTAVDAFGKHLRPFCTLLQLMRSSLCVCVSQKRQRCRVCPRRRCLPSCSRRARVSSSIDCRSQQACLFGDCLVLLLLRCPAVADLWEQPAAIKEEIEQLGGAYSETAPGLSLNSLRDSQLSSTCGLSCCFGGAIAEVHFGYGKQGSFLEDFIHEKADAEGGYLSEPLTVLAAISHAVCCHASPESRVRVDVTQAVGERALQGHLQDQLRRRFARCVAFGS